jgi:cyclopropane-fatty-acyl-phospholipid synthase
MNMPNAPDEARAAALSGPLPGLSGPAPSGLGKALLDKLVAAGPRTAVCFRVQLPDGAAYQNHATAPAVALTFRNARGIRRAAMYGHVGLFEAYFDGDLDIDGDIALVFRAGMDSKYGDGRHPLIRIRNAWHEFRYGNKSIDQAKWNARYHYALGKDFYATWLDLPAMMYTCGYWKEGTRTVEEAQRNKMHHVCRKVQLKPGESFVDIGTGFGGLLFHAYEHYGALGTGINACTEQVEDVRRDIEQRGLQDKLKVVECDFREIPGQYDKMLSIGTLEHAGRDQLGEVIKAHADCLKPGGMGVIHFIGHVGVFETEYYIREHIFPGGWIPSLALAIMEMEKHGLEVVDVENLRRHYALTLDAWAERFERRWDEIHRMDPKKFDERFRRKWRTYLFSCAEMFRSANSHTHLFQVTVSKGNMDHRYPMSRKFLYTQDP